MIEKHRKISGFTLSDVLVALAISGIILGIIFTAISLITQNIGNIKNNYIQTDILQLAEQQIILDINRFPVASYSEFENKLVFKSPLDSVTYFFKEDYILRNRDTLPLGIIKKTIFIKGETVKKGAMDALKLTCEKGTESVIIFVFKENDTYTLLNNGT